MHALSTRNEECERASRPFSKSRDGFVMGEGGACLLLIEEKEIDERSRVTLSEFSTPLSRDILPFIREHLICISRGAGIYKRLCDEFSKENN